MNQGTTTGPELQVVTTVTGWPQSRIDRLMEMIQSLEADFEPRPLDGSGVTGWTEELVEKAFELLAGSRANVQIKAVKFAIEHGGVVGRDDVYELGSYGEGRSLKGFTRPANRATQALRESGELPESAVELLEPIYDATVSGYQRARGFRIPSEIVRVHST